MSHRPAPELIGGGCSFPVPLTLRTRRKAAIGAMVLGTGDEWHYLTRAETTEAVYWTDV
jgi:hypothetical protein